MYSCYFFAIHLLFLRNGTGGGAVTSSSLLSNAGGGGRFIAGRTRLALECAFGLAGRLAAFSLADWGFGGGIGGGGDDGGSAGTGGGACSISLPLSLSSSDLISSSWFLCGYAAQYMNIVSRDKS